jgi:hypothetical protein
MIISLFYETKHIPLKNKIVAQIGIVDAEKWHVMDFVIFL